MSKIKANRLEPRTETGTLTIGNPTGATVFDGEVILPQYATLEHIEDIVAGDLAVELTNYQKMDEKNVPNGYAGLDANGKVPGSMLEDETKYDKVGGDISGTVRLTSPNRDIDVLAGTTGSLRYDGGTRFRWGNGANFSEQKIDMQGHPIINLQMPIADNDAATKFYVDGHATGQFLPLTGGDMSGDIDMKDQRVKGLAHIPIEDQDAASKYYVDTASEEINHTVEIQVFPAVNDFTEIFTLKNGGTNCMRVLGSGDWWSNHNRIREIADPVADDDAATKAYVDTTLSTKIAALEARIVALGG